MTPSSPGSERPWERLQAFSACHELALAVHRATREWLEQDEDNLDLVQEARNTARAAPALIMEGVEQRPGGFRRCLSAATGKLARLSYILVLARDQGLISQAKLTDLEIRRHHAQRVTRGLWRAVGKRAMKPAK